MDSSLAADRQAVGNRAEDLEHIKRALQASLDPRIANDVRQQAFRHLEAVKSQPNAPLYGFELAGNSTLDVTLRYYGLQLLEFAIRYRWNEYGQEETAQLLTWVTTLTDAMRPDNPLFFRNKLAQLWVEVAKRSWGEEWVDMDQQLAALWDKPPEEKGVANKILVLRILEQLSEDVINGEDAVAGLRLDVLGNALNEIMLPYDLYTHLAGPRKSRQEFRFGTDGWLRRTCNFFAQSLQHASGGGASEMVHGLETAALRALDALRSAMSWISLTAADEINLVEYMYIAFHSPNLAIQTAAVEVLYVMLSRHWNPPSQDTWIRLCRQALRPDRIAMIRRTYETITTAPGEDDGKYTLRKKISDLVSVLADAIAQSQDTHLVDDTLDLPSFIGFSLLILQSSSLTVSIPVLHSWTKLMAVQEDQILDNVLSALPTLLNICSERLLRYESLPDDVHDELMEFLNEDFDTTPERHAFLGNYRRYCNTIIVTIARSRPIEALSYVLGRMHSILENGPYTYNKGLSPANYSRNALPVLTFDAQYNVVAGTIKGFSAWTKDIAELPAPSSLRDKADRDEEEAMRALQQWCSGLVGIPVQDPSVAAQVLQALVLVLRTVHAPLPNFVLSIVQQILNMSLDDDPAHEVFSEAVKAFEALRVIELQKLAWAFPNHLLEVYQDLEPKIEQLVHKNQNDQRLIWGYKAFLFMIIHRATRIDNEARMVRLQQMVQPVIDSWLDASFNASVETLQSFCSGVGLSDLPAFYETHGFDKVPDWSSQMLNESGQAKQNLIKDKSDHLPLRMTKSMLSATIEKLRSGTDEFEIACALWTGVIPAILPNLLKILRHAQAFYNMANWSQCSPRMQAVIRRTLQDRFWQSGISSESKDEFYARISGTKTSYEGFASTVRGTMRFVREQGYHILYLMTKFEEQFYGLSDLANPLAEALFSDAVNLSANHLHPIINLTTGIVQRCPTHHRAQFLPPVIRNLFATLDTKINAEWESIRAVAEENRQEDDELSDEMRTESVLRQLTFSMVSFVPFLLEFDRVSSTRSSPASSSNDVPQPTLARVVFSDTSILEPLIMFCTHALRMRDTRCCATICRVFRGMIPMFAGPQAENADSTVSMPPEAAAQVREFICTEVLKACITSLHEPYFVDMQRDLAALIAQIILLYAPMTSTPRDVLLSLPNMSATRVTRAIAKIHRAQNDRAQRAQVLELLESVRGRSIYEAGRIDYKDGRVASSGKKSAKNGVHQRYMEVEARPSIEGNDSGLEGVAGLFGDA